MRQKAKTRSPRGSVNLSPADRADAKAVAVTQWDETQKLQAQGLDVRRVVKNTVTWARFPTEAEQAFAAQLLGRFLSHSV